ARESERSERIEDYTHARAAPRRGRERGDERVDDDPRAHQIHLQQHRRARRIDCREQFRKELTAAIEQPERVSRSPRPTRCRKLLALVSRHWLTMTEPRKSCHRAVESVLALLALLAPAWACADVIDSVNTLRSAGCDGHHGALPPLRAN